MEKKINAIIKRPGEHCYQTKITNQLKSYQEYVGGYIETVTLDDCVIICNEEGRIMNLPYNCVIDGYSFVGTIVVVGRDDENADFTDVPMNAKEFASRYLRGRWIS